MDTNINHWTPLDSRNPVAHDARIAKMKRERIEKMQKVDKIGNEALKKDQQTTIKAYKRKERAKQQFKQKILEEQRKLQRKQREKAERRRKQEPLFSKPSRVKVGETRRKLFPGIKDNFKRKKKMSESERRIEIQKIKKELEENKRQMQIAKAKQRRKTLDSTPPPPTPIPDWKSLPKTKGEREREDPLDGFDVVEDVTKIEQLALPIEGKEGALPIPDDQQSTNSLDNQIADLKSKMKQKSKTQEALKTKLRNVTEERIFILNEIKKTNDNRLREELSEKDEKYLLEQMTLDKEIEDIQKEREAQVDQMDELLRRQDKGTVSYKETDFRPQASMDDLHPFVMKPAPPQLHMQKLHMQTSMEKVELADPAMETLADDVHVQAVQPMKCGDKMACHKHEPAKAKMKCKSHDGTHEPAEGMFSKTKKKKKEKKKKKKSGMRSTINQIGGAIKSIGTIFGQHCDSCGELHDGIHDCEVQALVKMLDGYDSEGTALEKPRCPTMGIASRKMHEMNIEDVL